jgi:serine/threonine protein phosphatase 1
MMLRCLTGEAHLIKDWLKHGGDTCARSYGIDPSRLLHEDIETIEHLLMSHIPSSHLDLLSKCVDSVRFGDYFLVHAGVRPGVALDQQSTRDFRWIREEFLAATDPFEATIVHGHTILDAPEVKPTRIGIDTGAYKSGILTAIRLEDEQQEIISTRSVSQNV